MSDLTFNPIPSPELLNAAATGLSRPERPAADAPGDVRPDSGAADGENPFAALLSGVLQGAASWPATQAPAATSPDLVPVTATFAVVPAGTVLPEPPGSLTTSVVSAAGAATAPLTGNALPATGNNLPLSLEPLAAAPVDFKGASPDAPVRDAAAVRVSLSDLAATRPLVPLPPAPGTALPASIADAGTEQQNAAAAASFLGRFANRGVQARGLQEAGLQFTGTQVTGSANTESSLTDLLPAGVGDGSDPFADVPLPDTVNLRLTVADLLRTIVTPTVGAQLAAFAATADKGAGQVGTAAGSATPGGTAPDIMGTGLPGRLGNVSLPALQPLGNAGSFASGLADRLLTLGGPGAHSARLQLHPEQLGALEVEIRLDDGTAQVWFGTSTTQAREAIVASLPKLHELFAEQGIQLTHTQVDSGTGQRHGDAYRRAPESPAGYRDMDWRQGARAATAPVGRPAGARLPSSRLVDAWA